MRGLFGRVGGEEVVDHGWIQPGKDLLERIVAMLSKLVERFDPESYRVREMKIHLWVRRNLSRTRTTTRTSTNGGAENP